MHLSKYRWPVVSIAFTLFLLSAFYSEAGMVYGRVSDADGHFRPGNTFLLIGDQGSYSVKTDKHRDYKINVPPGTYRVEFQSGNTVWEAWIQSFREPARQNIYLLRRR